MTKIKICGITNREDALLAANLGVDALGFVFAESPRQVSPEEAREIISHLPPLLVKAGVFVNESLSRILEIVDFCQLNLVQLSGDEDDQFCLKLNRPYVKVFKVFDARILKLIKTHPSPYFILDTYEKGKGGGTGKTFYWEIAKMAVNVGRVILAGGLTPENLYEALEEVKPYGVDVSSGVEERPRKKDRSKLFQFVETVRVWDREMDILASMEGGSFQKH